MEVREVTVRTIHDDPAFAGLISEYIEESSLAGMPPPCWELDTYLKMESVGFLHSLGAYRGDDLIGFMLLLVSVLPHYGIPVATSESYFVAREYRSTGAGLRLLREAEKLAASLGAVGILVGAPIDGKLNAVLSKTEYMPTNTVYFRSFECSP